MSKKHKTPLLFVMDILESIEKIEKYRKAMTYDEFIKDDKTKDAVVRNLEIIGEAANSIPESIREQYPEIPWRSVTDMRNKLIHEYFGVSYLIVWETIEQDLPLMKEKMEEICHLLEKENQA